MSENEPDPEHPTYDYQRLRGRAVSLARRWGYGHECEDFGSYAVMARFDGSIAKLEHMWIDYLRLKYGNKRSPHYLNRAALVETEALPADPNGKLNADVCLWDEHAFETEDLIRMDDPLHHTIATMAVVHEMSRVEIAEVVALSPSRVGQIIQDKIAPVVRRRMREG